jgi:hypothetical protein
MTGPWQRLAQSTERMGLRGDAAEQDGHRRAPER